MISMLPVSLFHDIMEGGLAIEKWAETAKEMGLDALDISILFVRDRTPRGISEFRAKLGSAGLPLAMVATYPDFTVPDQLSWERELQKGIADIAIASELGARYVRITAGQYYPGQPYRTALDQVCAAFETCAEYASRWGVQLLWENHSKPGAWDRADFNYDPERFRLMYQRLKGGPVRLNYDIANAHLLNCGPGLLEECYPDVASVHVNDVKSVEPLQFTGIGKGSAPLLQTFVLLAQKGFDGLYSIEETSAEGLAGAQKAVKATKKLLEDARSAARETG